MNFAKYLKTLLLQIICEKLIIWEDIKDNYFFKMCMYLIDIFNESKDSNHIFVILLCLNWKIKKVKYYHFLFFNFNSFFTIYFHCGIPLGRDFPNIRNLWGSEFSSCFAATKLQNVVTKLSYASYKLQVTSYKLQVISELQNLVTQNDVTLSVTNSKYMIEFPLSSP